MALVPNTKNLVTIETQMGTITICKLSDLHKAIAGGYISEDAARIVLASTKALLDEDGGTVRIREKDVEVYRNYSPEGVHVLDRPRIGDEVKDKYIGHVHEAFAQGYLDESEHDARVEAMMAARTEDEVAFLATDLPEKLKVTEPASKVPEKSKARREVFARGECAFWFVLVAINVLNLVHEGNALFATVFGALMVTFGFMFVKKSR